MPVYTCGRCGRQEQARPAPGGGGWVTPADWSTITVITTPIVHKTICPACIAHVINALQPPAPAEIPA